MTGPEPDTLDDALRARGLRSTLQRRLVLQAVIALGHGTPEQICHQVRAGAPSLSPSTVYRTLELLEELGVVSHTHLGHGAPMYQAATHADHLHLVCRRCGGVQEAAAATASALVAELSRRYGFEVDLGHLSLDGLCLACAGTAASPEVEAEADPEVETDTEVETEAAAESGATPREATGPAER